MEMTADPKGIHVDRGPAPTQDERLPAALFVAKKTKES
jgi:hypothetical protein